MQILKKDMKSGEVKIKTESPDDLWHLEKIIESGDIVTGRTFRKTTIKRGSQIGEGERESLVLSIEVEKTSYHKDTHKLRLTGPIREGPEDKVQIGSYHTISVGLNYTLAIKKPKWKPHHLDRLEKAKQKPGLLLVCVLDREEADFAELRESGITQLAKIYSKKRSEDDNLDDYRNEVAKYITDNHERFHAVLIAGPGFERENLAKLIKENYPELSKKTFTEHAHSTGTAGINEVIKKSAARVLRESRIAQETALVEELMARINTDGLAVYGKNETEKAVNSGAVETLMISEDKIPDFENLMDLAEKTGAKVRIISSDHEAGERFLHLGGIGGFLRFKI